MPPPARDREKAVITFEGIRGGNSDRGQVVFSCVCAECHQTGESGKEFGPKLDDVSNLCKRDEISKHILWPNEKNAKGFQTVQFLTNDGPNFKDIVLML